MLQNGNPFFMIVAGLVIGLVHALEPDHLGAVSTQLLKKDTAMGGREQRLRSITIRSSMKGVLWGMGHASSIVLIGLLVAGLSLSIVDSFFVGAEVAVGIMLVVLGILMVRRKGSSRQENRVKEHTHGHEHTDGVFHTHHHTHEEDHAHSHRSYIIGCIHGIAGSGGIIALVASAMDGFEMTIYFLALFGIGSIVGMMLASGALGASLALAPKARSLIRYLRYVMAGVVMMIGINIILTISGVGWLPFMS